MYVFHEFDGTKNEMEGNMHINHTVNTMESLTVGTEESRWGKPGRCDRSRNWRAVA